ncbi:MAG TPA: hypothetical protein VF483_13770 [Gemmatimonadaceae bacterium]
MAPGPGIAEFAKKSADLAKSTAAARNIAPAPVPSGPPRRVAVLPVRILGQSYDTLVTATKALRDSINRAVIAAGYTTASDADLLDLVSVSGPDAPRQTALDKKIGALVSVDVYPRGDEVQAIPQVLDVWRNQLSTERVSVDRNRPQELTGAVRSVTHALERVSWRSATDARGAIVFAIDNQLSPDSIAVLGRSVEDSIKSVISKRMGWKLLGDSAIRVVRDGAERRSAGIRLGAGVLVSATMFRQRGDSMSLRISVRDMSEDNVLPVVEVRLARATFDAGLAPALERFAAQLATVNWGPKRAQGAR